MIFLALLLLIDAIIFAFSPSMRRWYHCALPFTYILEYIYHMCVDLYIWYSLKQLKKH